ncbi:IclR family transcriptional regulator [Roseomonas gilardii subsp. gilardii]|uniref:IclR family transcriptional regulator n=1 Tax=Roseomonas gilardii TaxID=257708 RepID=UPI001FF8A407|nr:IclR family transcriptional regulator [Roseomonas gilardii]UPG73371.1 IclR family transcriptional regulator [Roseomonas gilardii subsp. gilardii]
MQRAVRLMEYIAAGGPTANLSEAARRTGINRATLARLLDTLEYEGVLERAQGGEFRLGLRFLGLAASALASRDLVSLARPVLARLAAETGLSSYLVVLSGGEALYLAREMPDTPLVSHIRIGSRVPAHLTTPGRVLLAPLTPAERRARLGLDPLPTATPHSPATHAALDAVLAEDTARGCAWSFSAYEPGVDSCAAVVRGQGDGAIAALSLAGPAAQFGRAAFRAEVERQVKGAAAELSRLMGAGAGAAREV